MYRLKFILSILFPLICCTGKISAQLSNTGLVLYLPLNGNGGDSSGNGYHGIEYNILPAPDADGNPGKACSFGPGSRIFINNPALLRGEHEELTILMKVYINDLPAFGQASFFSSFFSWFYLAGSSLFEKGHLQFFAFTRTTAGMNYPLPAYRIWGMYDAYWQRDCASGIGAIPWLNSEFYTKDSTRMIGKWFSYAFVFNKGNLKQYHNCTKVYDRSVQIGRLKPCETEQNNDIRIYVGNTQSGFPEVASQGASWMLDELRIYKRVLEEDEIKAYAGNLCNKKEPEPFINIKKDFCNTNRLRISDSTFMYNVPVVSRKWTISRDGFALNDSIGFNYKCTRFGNYSVRLRFTDAEGYGYIKDTTFLVTDVTEKHFLSTTQNPVYLCGGARSANVNVPGGTSYQWTPCVDLSACNTASVTITPQTNRLYTVAATNAMGCTDTLLLTVKKAGDTSDVYVPGIFSPNNDGVNDVFRIHPSVHPAGFILEVYNRWGAVVFKTTDPRLAWNGELNGIPQPAGMYVWRIKYNGGEGCPDTKKKGTVMLVR